MPSHTPEERAKRKLGQIRLARLTRFRSKEGLTPRTRQLAEEAETERNVALPETPPPAGFTVSAESPQADVDEARKAGSTASAAEILRDKREQREALRKAGVL